MAPKPLLCKGDIVTYQISARDAEIINQRRSVYAKGDAPQGLQVHMGNPVIEGNPMPMIITKFNNNSSVNGQVFLDGTDTYWVVDVKEGEEPGEYGVD